MEDMDYSCNFFHRNPRRGGRPRENVLSIGPDMWSEYLNGFRDVIEDAIMVPMFLREPFNT